MIWVTYNQILLMHNTIIESTGGEFGLRDKNLLESALKSPLQTYDKIELYPSIIKKIARLAYGLTKNHPFIDGNKRIAAHCMLVLLQLNDIQIKYSQQELSDTFLKLASGNLSFENLEDWIIAHQVF